MSPLSWRRANLSRDYFTNRQDRYLHIRHHPRLADYFHMLINVGQSISYSLEASPAGDFSFDWPQGSPHIPELTARDSRSFKAKAAALFKDVQAYWTAGDPRNDTPYTMHQSDDDDTQLRPFLQIGQLGIREETDVVVPALLAMDRASGLGRIDWTSGYFSLDVANRRRLLACNVDSIRVVCASPKVRIVSLRFYGRNLVNVHRNRRTAFTRALA